MLPCCGSPLRGLAVHLGNAADLDDIFTHPYVAPETGVPLALRALFSHRRCDRPYVARVLQCRADLRKVFEYIRSLRGNERSQQWLLKAVRGTLSKVANSSVSTELRPEMVEELTRWETR